MCRKNPDMDSSARTREKNWARVAPQRAELYYSKIHRLYESSSRIQCLRMKLMTFFFNPITEHRGFFRALILDTLIMYLWCGMLRVSNSMAHFRQHAI